MSAFIIDQTEMHAVVRVLCASGEAETFHEHVWPVTETGLGRQLYRMNIAAVVARYGDSDDLPGPCDPGLRQYPETYEAPDMTQGFLTLAEWQAGDDAVRSLAYQCAEGNIPETWPQYKLLIAARDRITARVAAMARDAARAAAAERAANPPRYISIVETAKIIRAELKAAFPQIKFSVTSSKYSMGCSIRISWTDGPSTAAVHTITDQRYGTGFNGMTDSTTHHDGTLNGEAVHFAGSRPHCNRTISESWETKCARAWDKLDGYAHCALMNDYRFPRWPEDRPGYRLAVFLSEGAE